MLAFTKKRNSKEKPKYDYPFTKQQSKKMIPDETALTLPLFLIVGLTIFTYTIGMFEFLLSKRQQIKFIGFIDSLTLKIDEVKKKFAPEKIAYFHKTKLFKLLPSISMLLLPVTVGLLLFFIEKNANQIGLTFNLIVLVSSFYYAALFSYLSENYFKKEAEDFKKVRKENNNDENHKDFSEQNSRRVIDEILFKETNTKATFKHILFLLIGIPAFMTFTLIAGSIGSIMKWLITNEFLFTSLKDIIPSHSRFFTFWIWGFLGIVVSMPLIILPSLMIYLVIGMTLGFLQYTLNFFSWILWRITEYKDGYIKAIGLIFGMIINSTLTVIIYKYGYF